jgi:hypothetical protein
LKETKVVIDLAKQARSGVVEEGSWTLQPLNCKCERFVSELFMEKLGPKSKVVKSQMK